MKVLLRVLALNRLAPVTHPAVSHLRVQGRARRGLGGKTAIHGLVLLALTSSLLSADPVSAGRVKNPAIDWESLPTIRTGVRVWTHTSKNPLNVTIMDWTNYTLKDKDGYEEAYYKGKNGMLVQDWFGSQDKIGNMKLFLSGKDKPSYDQPFLNYFNQPDYPFNLWHQDQKILWAFPCLPFDSTFRAYVEKRPEWYQFTLHLYREPEFSEAMSPEDAAVLQKKIAEPVGTFPGNNPGNQTKSSSVEISTQGTATLFDSAAPGVIRSIKINPPSAKSEILDNLTIRITTDGEVSAELPVSMFFGGYVNVNMNKAKGMAAGFDGKSLYCYFPMPFWKSMKVELVNTGAVPVKIDSSIGWSDTNTYPADSTGTFRVKYNNRVAVKAGDPSFVNLDVEGSGTLVGCVSEIVGEIESNFTTYTDDSDTPTIETTGGEDYFNHSYGMHDGFDTAFSGGLGGKRIGYRFQIVDYVPFLSSLKFTQDHALDFAHDHDGIFLSAIFYYHNPRKFISLTDTLDVGKGDSETAHHYQIEGSRARVQTDSGRYENDIETPVSDDGRWTDKESSFDVAISPENDGVRLRKRINQTAYHQEIEVYVDGDLAGTWFEEGSNYVDNYDNKKYHDLVVKKYADLGSDIPTWQNGKMPAIFRDTIFDIPSALTKGKKQLHLRFVTKGSLATHPADTGMTNEYYYWVYSYAKP